MLGDSPGSYAYDGKRVRKWSVETAEYGSAWLEGDVIGVALDADDGCVRFARWVSRLRSVDPDSMVIMMRREPI